MRMLDEQNNNDVEVTFADQQRINAFSRLNNRFVDAETQFTVRQEEQEVLSDLSMELELVDEEGEVLYKIGDAFVYVPGAEAITLVERDTARVEAELQRLAHQKDEYQREMDELKVALYAKFGDNINLER